MPTAGADECLPRATSPASARATGRRLALTEPRPSITARRGRKLVGEWDGSAAALPSARSGRGGAGSRGRESAARRSASRLLASAPRSRSTSLAGRDRGIAGAERLAAGRQGTVDRALLESGELLAPGGRVLAGCGPARPAPRATERCEPLAFGELRRTAAPSAARITGKVESSRMRTLTSSSVPPRSASASSGGRSRHRRKPRQQRRDRPLLPVELRGDGRRHRRTARRSWASDALMLASAASIACAAASCCARRRLASSRASDAAFSSRAVSASAARLLGRAWASSALSGATSR